MVSSGQLASLVRVVELVTSSLMKGEAVALIVLGEAVQVCWDPRNLSLVYPRVVNRQPWLFLAKPCNGVEVLGMVRRVPARDEAVALVARGEAV